MAYFYSSNYNEGLDNYQYYYQPYSYNYEPSEPRYVQSYDHTDYYGNAYQQAPTAPLVGYYYSAYNQPDFLVSKNVHDNSEYYDPVLTQLVVSYSTAGNGAGAANDLDFKEYNPEPFHGGYDISETYGKALPPSDEICHPPTKIDQTMPSAMDDSYDYASVPSPYGKKEENLESEAKPKPAVGNIPSQVIQEENALDSEEDEEYEEEEEEEEEEGEEEELGEMQIVESDAIPTNGGTVSHMSQENAFESEEDEEEEEEEDQELLDDNKARNEGDYGKEIRRQIPPGYGMEAMDLCEGLFGGYFPCLSKRNQGSYDQRGSHEQTSNSDCWQGTADYLFGNPNPYGGTMPELGSYGDPVNSYQRHHPQQALSVVQYGGHSSGLHTSSYHYGEYQ